MVELEVEIKDEEGNMHEEKEEEGSLKEENRT
jgi:hypothetical protein